MKAEIALLRDELAQAKLETQLLPSKPQTGSSDRGDDHVSKASVDGERTGVSSETPSGDGSEGIADMKVRLEELEEDLNRSNLMLASLCRCLEKLEAKVKEAVSEGGRVENPQLDKILKECLDLLRSCDRVDGDFPAVGVAAGCSPPSDGSKETILRLQAELEHCRADLKTDEQAFAEKAEEATELQFTCEVLVREKARAEAMWVAAQESEAELQEQMEQLQRRLAALMGGAGGVAKEDGGVVGDDGGVARDGDKEEGGVVRKDEGVAGEDENMSKAEINERDMGGGVAGGVAREKSLNESQSWTEAEQASFTATRSLLKDIVKTDSLEVGA